MPELNGTGSADPPEEGREGSPPAENEPAPVTEGLELASAAEQCVDVPHLEAEAEPPAAEPEPHEEPSPVVVEQPTATMAPVEEAVSFQAASSSPMADVTSQAPPGSEQPAPHPETVSSSAVGEESRPLTERFQKLCRWLSDASGLIGLIGLTLGGLGLWQVYRQLDQANVAQCIGVFDALSQLDKSYGYGFCSLSNEPDDDFRLAEAIEPVVKRAEGCDPGLADHQRISFYRSVQRDLGSDASVCKSSNRTGAEGIWLRLHCLQRQDDQDYPTRGSNDWAVLAGEFEELSKDPKRAMEKGRLQDCAAISRVQAYHRLAAITGLQAATDHMMAAANTIMESGEMNIAELMAGDLAQYNEGPCRKDICHFNEGDVVQAYETLDMLLVKEAKEDRRDNLDWQSILPRASSQLGLTAWGVVVDHRARTRNKDRKHEQDYLKSAGSLERELRYAKQDGAADFVLAQKGAMKDGWYQTTVLAASGDCENDLDDRRRSDALTLESMRAIYSWWTQVDLNVKQWEELQEEGPPWLNWWSPHNEVTTTLCSLAANLIEVGEAQRRFEHLLREVPDGGGICYSAKAKSTLWTAGVKKLPWLQEEAKKKCAP